MAGLDPAIQPYKAIAHRVTVSLEMDGRLKGGHKGGHGDKETITHEIAPRIPSPHQSRSPDCGGR
jgi:hypothetical protein